MDKQSQKRLVERQKRLARQIKERGWSDEDTWSLDWTIAKFILPRLKRFAKLQNGFPGSTTSKEWNEILEQMIEAFELYSKGGWELDKEDIQKAQKGLELFAKWYGDLWW